MRKNILIILSVIIIFILLFILFCIWQRNHDFSRLNKSALYVSLSMGNISNVYVFKEKENIENFIALEKFFEHYQKNGSGQKNTVKVQYGYVGKYEKVYHNIPYELFNDLLNTKEALGQKQYMLNDDVDNVGKITLKSSGVEEKCSIIENEDLIKRIIGFIKTYYSLPGFSNNIKYSRLICVNIYIEDSKSCFKINSDYREFFEFLKENDLYDELLISPEDIEIIKVIKGNSSKEITDKVLIGKMLDRAYNGYYDISNYYLECKINPNINSNYDILYCSLSNDTVPLEIKYLFD